MGLLLFSLGDLEVCRLGVAVLLANAEGVEARENGRYI
jgi:hypothetical protein